jgi:ketosteroid isomerase-like protein
VAGLCEAGAVTADDIEDLAERFFAAIEAGDSATVAAIYADDATVWHNYDQVEESKARNLKVLAWVSRQLRGATYTQVRRVVIEDGFIQQHVLTGTAPDGTELAIAAMMRVFCRDGAITRIEEYLDPAQAASLQR